MSTTEELSREITHTLFHEEMRPMQFRDRKRALAEPIIQRILSPYVEQVEALVEAATPVLESGEFFSRSEGGIFPALSSHDYIQGCRCNGCRLWRMFRVLETEIAALRAALAPFTERKQSK